MIISTGYGSDDAVVLMMALKSGDISVEATTTVGENIPLDFAIKNALTAIGVTGGRKPSLFVGAVKPLLQEFVTAVNVHGKDGMGNTGPIRPTLFPENERAVDAIIRIAKSCLDKVELIAIGPATNVALAIMKDPDIMRRVRQTYIMGTSGFGPGDCTPVSEFNVYVGAEVFYIMITVGIPITIIGSGLCLGRSTLTKTELDTLMGSGKKEAMFAIAYNRMVVDYNITTNGQYFLDLPDTVTIGVMLQDDIVLERKPCYAYICLKEEVAYGQAVLNDGSKLAIPEGFGGHSPNVEVCTKIDTDLSKERLLSSPMQYLAWTQNVRYFIKEIL